MNSFIPALIAVLLAEVGGRSTLFSQFSRPALAAVLLGLTVTLAAFGGSSLSGTMNIQARTLVLAVALILTGCSQFGAVSRGKTLISVGAMLMLVARSDAPFLAFAFALWRSAPFGSAAGAFIGVAGAVALGMNIGTAAPVKLIWLRRSAGITLVIVGVYGLLWALRLVG